MTTDWQTRCTEIGLDTEEVRKVSHRYDMYKDYTDNSSSETLPLDRWYKWYRVEKISEGHGMATPPAEGCSVTFNQSDRGPVISEQDFLNLLQDYRNGRS
jgi:hypothetical protein